MTSELNTTENSPTIAIDLGTTNSLVGLFDQGNVRLIPNSSGYLFTPSAIALDQDQQILIGQSALELRSRGDEVLSSFKRLMGTTQKLSLNNRQFSAEELSALILKSLKADAEAALDQIITEAVITVPAYFNDIQRQATISAAQMAGLNVSRLINEPTAAALAYGLGQTDDSCFLIFDLGGGTFDVSIVELFEGVIEVRASTGDNFLGGDDFVTAIVNAFWQQHGAQFAQDTSFIPPDLLTALTAKAQQTMHQLTTAEQTTLVFNWQDQQVSIPISVLDFNAWIEPLLSRLRRPLERALRDARLKPSQIDQIVMVGGATRIPAVRKLVTKLFGRFPSTSIQPDEAIVRGACIQAGLKNKDQALKEVVLTDVCPFSLGIAIGEEGYFDPIIERNTVIPASKVNHYHSMREGQREIILRIYQGEHRLCQENIFLGELMVKLPPNKEQLTIDVRFSYNPNGILDVDVHVPSSGEKLQKVLINNQSVMSAEQIQQARQQLEALKIHPRDTLANKALILKADRLYREMTGDLRTHVAQQTQVFVQALDSQDDHKIRQARPQFEQFLKDIEEASLFEAD
ncbi:MAG: molecular chaperone HscC [Moraxellaceae bacterium]|nr:MAG: molecular chaperone HscC [Moraxellaceae bacterium]